MKREGKKAQVSTSLFGKKVREKAGQVSTEYLVIIGFILILMVPITVIYFKYTGSTSDVVGGAKTSHIANEIVKAANEVYSYGEGSQKKIKLSFPEGITGISFSGKEIIFKLKNSKGQESEIVEVADAPFRATTIPVTPGQKDIIVRSEGVSVSVIIACNDGQVISGSKEMCNALCNPAKDSCTLTCSNKAWVASTCI